MTEKIYYFNDYSFLKTLFGNIKQYFRGFNKFA